jgi:hypothetical protein
MVLAARRVKSNRLDVISHMLPFGTGDAVASNKAGDWKAPRSGISSATNPTSSAPIDERGGGPWATGKRRR